MQITQLSGMPSGGALLGTSTPMDIINNINMNLNRSHEFFGSVNDIFSKTREVIITNIIEPTRRTAQKLMNIGAKLTKQDKIIPLETFKDFTYVPPSMHLPILMYEPIRELHAQGRIDGFGYDPDNLPTEDVYGRLINNGTIEIDPNTDFNKKGTSEINLTWVFDSDDPDLTFDELDCIRSTRETLQRMLDETETDPTNYPCARN